MAQRNLPIEIVGRFLNCICSELLSLSLGFQVVFPKGGDIPQPLNDGGEMFDDVVHLLFGIINRKAETDGTVSGCKGNTHGP